MEKCVAATATTACPTSGTNGTLYWRGTGSDTLDESDLTGNVSEEYIYFNGQRVARYDVAGGAVHYYFSDNLGTHGVIENANATVCEQDTDYYPYGGQENDYCSGTSIPQNYKFTGKERDAESGLDYFGARHHGSSLGRFMSPDPIGIMKQKFGDPQQWNMYVYVRNNPLRFTDPTGMYLCGGDKTQCGVVHTALDLAKTAVAKLPEGSKERKALEKAIAAYGKEGIANGVVVKFDDLKGAMESGTSTKGKTTTVTFDLKQMAKDFAHAPSPADEVAGTVAHEGAIAGDQRTNGEPAFKADVVREETAGATAEAGVHEGLGSREPSWGLWDPAWKPAEARGKMDQGIKREVKAAVDDVCRSSDICEP